MLVKGATGSTWRRHHMETLSTLLILCQENPLVSGGYIYIYKLLNKHLSYFWDAMTLMWHQCNVNIMNDLLGLFVLWAWRVSSRRFKIKNLYHCCSIKTIVVWFSVLHLDFVINSGRWKLTHNGQTWCPSCTRHGTGTVSRSDYVKQSIAINYNVDNIL